MNSNSVPQRSASFRFSPFRVIPFLSVGRFSRPYVKVLPRFFKSGRFDEV